MAGYKSLQVAEALNRVSASLTPQITTGSLANSVYGTNTNTASATLAAEQRLAENAGYYQSLYSKTGSDYARDTAVALGKGIVAVPQALSGIVDIADAGISALGVGLTGGNISDIQTGRFSKALESLGVGFNETQSIMDDWYSDAYKAQQAELAAVPGMSTEKSLQDNLSSLSETAGVVWDNPSLAFNTLIQSVPSIMAGGAIGRGAAALGTKAAGAVGEGAIMAGTAQEQMRSQSDTGYTTAQQALGALGIGVLGGAVGQLGARVASRSGARDVDSIAAGTSSNVLPASGAKSFTVGTLTEASEEAAQSAIENVIANVASERDAIQGLNQDLVLGTVAGGLMGAGMNAGNSIQSAALQALTKAAENRAAKVAERSPERTDTDTSEFTDVTSENYNPTAAIIREAKAISSTSTPEELTATKANIDKVLDDAETHLAGLNSIVSDLSKIDVTRNNIAAATAAIERFKESDPDRATHIAGIKESLEQQLANTEQYIGKEEQLASAVEAQTEKVNEARAMHAKYTPMFDAVAEVQSKDAAIFGAPTAYTPEQYAEAIADPSVPEASKVALRALSAAVQAQNAVKDIEAVNQQVVGASLDPRYKSTVQYLAEFGKAVQSKSIAAQQNLLSEIINFEASHVPKARLAESAMQLANAMGKPLQIIRTEGQEWVVNRGTPLKGKERAENGAITIHPVRANSNGSIDLVNYLQAEAAAVTATREAMQAMVGQQTPTEEVNELMNFEGESVPTYDPMQDALDSFNQEQREDNEWNSNARSEDPRTAPILETSANPAVTETSIPEGAQPSNGEPTSAEPLSRQSVSETELVFDENGVGRNVVIDTPKQSQDTDAAVEANPDVSEEGTPTSNVQVQDNVQEPVAESDVAEAADKDTKEVRKEERAKPINQRNLVTDGFNKKASVLGLNENFLSNYMVRGDNSQVVENAVGITDLTEKQKQVLSDFTGFANNMRSKIESIVSPKVGKTAKGNNLEDYRYQDFNQFLLVDGKLPENVSTAISAAMFTWMGENATKTIDTEEEVAQKMLLKDIEMLPANVYAALANVGTHQNTLAASLGQKAYQALGLKVTKDVDPARQSKVEMGLGMAAVAVMVQQGYLTRTTFTNEQMNTFIADTMNVNEDGKSGDNSPFLDGHQFSFLVPTTDANNELIKKVDMIVESSRQTGSIVGTLFNVPTDIKLPSTEPVTTVPNSFNNMDSQLPSFTKEVYEASQQNGYKLSIPAMQFMDKMPRKDLLKMFGFVEPNEDGESFPNMHKRFWKGQVAANQALERSIRIIEEQRNNLGDDAKEFFFEHTIWTNQRSGYDSAFNLQANKVHRAVAGMSAHVREVGVGEPTHNADGSTTTYGEFLMAVAMSSEEVADILGLKTVDKVSSKTYLAAFQDYLNTDRVQQGIASMAAILEGNKPAKEDIDNVSELVSEFGMGGMSVRALQALAQHYIADRDGARTFTSDIGFESDGVTNGPVITNVALNTADTNMLAAGGIFTDKNQTNVPAYKEQGGEDIYEQLGTVMKQMWADYKNDPDIKPRALASARALDILYPAFGARSGAKPIVTTSNYGAGNASIIRANSREVLNAFYKQLEKAGKANDTTKAGTLINAVNHVLNYHNSFLGSVPLAVAQGDIMEFMLTTAQENALMAAAGLQHGKAIKNTLETAMEEFQGVRDTLTNQAVTGYKVYEKIRDAMEQKALDESTRELIDGKPIEGLTTDELKKVRKSIAKYTPSVVSAMGNNSTNGKQSSIPLMKQETVWDSSKLNQQQFNFTGKFEKGKANQGKFSVRAGVRKKTTADPGVSGLALLIQSIDSFIAHSTLKGIPSQNYHDANASRVGDGKKMAKIQNEAFVDALITTHVSREFVRAYMNPLQALVEGVIDPTKDELTAMFGEEGYKSAVAAVNSAYARDLAKLNGMKDWENVNQYGTEGGHFVMTDAKRKSIVDAVQQLREDMVADLKKAEAIDKYVLGKINETAPVESGYSINDELAKGTSPIQVVQDFLKANKSTDERDARFSELFSLVSDMLKNNLPTDLEVNVINSGNPASNVVGAEKGLKAWFTNGKDGKPQINFLGDEAIPANVLVHELIHAATVGKIKEVQNNPEANPKAKESLDKLTRLYEHVKKHAESSPVKNYLVEYGVSNLEEFIATGFTYPDFVDYLSHITDLPKEVRTKSKIITALRAFVDSVFGLFGRPYTTKNLNAFEALVIDSTEFIGRTDKFTTQGNLFGAPEQARAAVSGYTAKEVFATLNSNLDPKFEQHLKEMMSQVSDTVYAGLDSKFLLDDSGNLSMDQAWEAYVDKGNTYTTDTATVAGFRMSDQESFAVESLYASLSLALQDRSMTTVYAELDKSFTAARKKLKPESFLKGTTWANATRDERRDAQDMHDYIFKLGNENPNHLARFISMAVGSQEFNNLLGFYSREVNATPTTSFEKIVEKVNTLLEYVTGLLTNTSQSQQLKHKIPDLAKELARIDSKHRNIAVSNLEQRFDAIGDFTDGLSNKLRDKVVSIAEHDNLANSRFTAVRLASNTTRLSAKGDLWTTLDVIKEGVNLENSNQRLGFFGELINEAANNTDSKNAAEQLMRMTKLNNQVKENIRDATTKNVLSTFEENGAYLTVEDKAAISAMLRSDVQALADTYSTKDIAKIYTDAAYRKQEINNLIGLIKSGNNEGQVMINRAKQLAWYMNTGLSSPGLQKNAQLIVSGFNTGIVVESSNPLVAYVDRLASLYAIEYTDNTTAARLEEVFKRELKNKTNGIDTAIKFHKELAKRAKDTLFVDNATSVIKGYMPEITNPNREVRIAGSEAEAKLLKAQFFTKVKDLSTDVSDPSTRKAQLFITEEANIQRLVSGAIEVVSTNRKGSSVFMDAKDLGRTINRVKAMSPTGPDYDPRKDPNTYMTPNYNTENKVIGFSYEMSGNNRDTLLERNNDFSDLLGAYAATNFNKVTVPQQNNRVVDAMHQDYKDNFADNPRAYVNVGPNSPDVGLRETWALLPDATRNHITSVWGKEGMYVRNDLLLIMFGYRKYSLNQAFDKMGEARNMFENLYTGIMQEVFGSKAKIRGVQAERAWQEGIGLMKDIIVIRNVKTMLFNTMSNAMLLMAHGVSPSAVVKDSMLSIRAGLAYRKDMALLMSAQQKLVAGVGDTAKLEQEVIRLERAINSNPLKSFIDEGMMPTIVEDVDPTADTYSYKNKLQQRIDGLTDNVPKSVKTAAKWAFVSPDTPLYKFLNNATQFSDFSSKYVMYKYYTTKAKEKMSHAEALQAASDNFINYDVPTSRGLQYLNDMGVVMFTKYNIRIQKALFQLLKKRPATALAQAAFINSFTNMESGIDPLIWFNMGNPLRSGALGLPSALDEPFPVKIMTSAL